MWMNETYWLTATTSTLLPSHSPWNVSTTIYGNCWDFPPSTVQYDPQGHPLMTLEDVKVIYTSLYATTVSNIRSHSMNQPINQSDSYHCYPNLCTLFQILLQ